MAFKAKGEQRALRSLRRAPQNFKLGVRDAAHMAGRILVRTAAQGILNKSKSGRLYGSHQASAPGEYPANLTGRHLKSIDYRFSGNTLRFGAGAPHSAYLEYGTSKMLPRPTIAAADRDAGPTVRNVLIRIPYQRITSG